MTDAVKGPLARFNKSNDPLFDKIIDGVLRQFSDQHGAAERQREYYEMRASEAEDATHEVRNLWRKDPELRKRLLDKAKSIRNIKHRRYSEDQWRTAIIGLGIAYTRGMYLPPGRSGGEVKPDGDSFTAMVNLFKGIMDPHRSDIDRVLRDVLADNAAIFLEILDRVQFPERFPEPAWGVPRNSWIPE